MRKVIVAVSDRAVGAFMNPFFAPSTGAAVRSFRDEVNRKESPMHGHPEDYELHHLGEWDEETGSFEVMQTFVVLVRGKDAIVKES